MNDRFAWLLLCVALVACESGSEPIQPTPPDTTGNGGTVQRGTLTLTVTATGEAAQVVQALGMAPGRLSGAQVTVRRVGSSDSRSGVTDANGQASFDELLAGTYDVSVVRLLTPAERAAVSGALGAGFADVNAFGGGGFTQVAPPATSANVGAVAGRRGSIVISEIFQHVAASTTSQYSHGRWLELYNNGDSTIYLDGMLLVRGIGLLFDAPERPCSVMEQYHLDPDGIWSQTHVRFPGSGNQYPVPPGRTVLIATDAIDHDEFWPGLHDMSGAAFEGVGSQDVDNPQVPNLIDVGIRRWESPDGHGWHPGGNGILALVRPIDDLAGLPTADLPGFTYPTYRRIPIDDVVDLVELGTFLPTPEIAALIGTLCNVVAPSLDRLPARLFDERQSTAVARRLLATLPDGRVILQRTKTSGGDFERRAATPGTVP